MDDDVRVVVADDNDDIAEFLELELTASGYSVRVASDGETAKALIVAFTPHCVIFDVDMPGLDGNQLSTWMRAEFGDDIVLVAISGWADTDRRVMETFARADHYLKKPLDAAALCKLLPPLRA